MQFVLDFLVWSAIVGIVLCIPLAIRAVRNELLHHDDPRFTPNSWLGRTIRWQRQRAERDSTSPGSDG
ncbi:hypothetical protein BJY17_000634 [Agromyces hippuratus]|uniref:Uncharacterized protein n=2 Tax=Agromyces hippuratus TaxID=286438 RepID=A0A852WQ68_9MICO|nr:hypothetical protein [Agromyces hippuratus]NYG19887.1 hypothetical protein [Agromyces hippuratus]